MRLGIPVFALTFALLLTGCGAGTDDNRVKVDSGAMEPAVKSGETVSYTPTDLRVAQPKPGDIVVLDNPWGTGNQVKRVVATAGQVIGCCDDTGRVTVDGTALDETYLATDSMVEAPPTDCKGRRFGPVTVEKDKVFVLGDNRLVSLDSRCRGTVDVRKVIGTITK
jgi:signal peptidase I